MMHLSFFSTLSFLKFSTLALLSAWTVLIFPGWDRLAHGSSQSEQMRGRPWISSDGKHAFIAPGPGDVRSPCPALNTLANHGYINRSGKWISASSMISSLTSIYYLSLPLATTLVAGGMFCCGGGIVQGISLDALAAHNKIEHDASLVHDDALPGAKFAPTQVNLTLVNDLLKTYPAGMGIDDFAEARLRRERLLLKEGRPQLNAIHEKIGQGEAALTWLLMKDATNVVKGETLQQFYGLEMFPEAYTIPTEEITFKKARNIRSKVKMLFEGSQS